MAELWQIEIIAAVGAIVALIGFFGDRLWDGFDRYRKARSVRPEKGQERRSRHREQPGRRAAMSGLPTP